MFKKQGKFYADWRDKSGTRKRKAFTSQRAALKFEAQQKDFAPQTAGSGKSLAAVLRITHRGAP
jgi:hypothetical protein